MPDGSGFSNQFCREELGTFPYVMRATWDRIVFTGTGLAPTVVSSEREMRERVRSTPGAVGYIRSGERSELLPAQPNVLLASLGGEPRGRPPFQNRCSPRAPSPLWPRLSWVLALFPWPRPRPPQCRPTPRGVCATPPA